MSYKGKSDLNGHYPDLQDNHAFGFFSQSLPSPKSRETAANGKYKPLNLFPLHGMDSKHTKSDESREILY